MRIPHGSSDVKPVTIKELIEFVENYDEALFFSSSSLHKELQSCSDLEEKLKTDEKVRSSLLKYYQRVKYRCTPFGLFAASGTGKWDSANHMSLSRNFVRHTDLDMSYTVVLAQHLTKISFIREHLLFYPNSSLYDVGSKLRYTEYFDKSNKRAFRTSQVDQSYYLTKILRLSQKGVLFKELTEILVKASIPREEAFTFINELVDAQVLVSELEPVLTGSKVTDQIFECLNRIQKQSPREEQLTYILDTLSTITSMLKELDEKIGNPVEKYEDLITLIRGLKIPFDASRLFKVDLFLETIESKVDPCGLDDSIKKNLIVAFKALSIFSESITTNHMSQFKEAFRSRYKDRFVPIMEVMDNERGIGYGLSLNRAGDISPLIDNITFNDHKKAAVSLSERELFLMRKLNEANAKGKSVIKISHTECSGFSEPALTVMPDSLLAYFRVLNNGVGGDRKIHLMGFTGPSATNALGRFANNNPEILGMVKQIADAEATLNSDKIIAEICHLPDNRVGNIMLRPRIRKYEIPYVAKSNAPGNEQLELSDLFLNLVDDRLVLWSKKHQSEVLPRMSNSHDFQHSSVPLYHFLCELQFQNVKPDLFFTWGNLSKIYSFFPRVEIERVIVEPATWLLNSYDYRDLTVELFDSQPEKIFDWKKKWNLPDRFFLIENDIELMIHFHESEPLLVKLFLTMIRKKSSIVLKEFLFDLENPLVTDHCGNGYTNEFFAPLVKNTPTKGLGKVMGFQNSELQDRFIPGSDWLYYKLYCGAWTGDYILTKKILPLIKLMFEKELIDSWFFIRYEDPNLHLRLRFHLTKSGNTGKIMEVVHDSLKTEHSDGTIWKIQLDTYERELNRYPADYIEQTEALFMNDSIYVANMVANLRGLESDENRWLFALVSVDRLLDDFKLNIEQKISLLELLRTSFWEEFKVNKTTKLEIDKYYRSKRLMIEEAFDGSKRKFEELFIILDERTKSNSSVVGEILDSISPEYEGSTFQELVSSYTHMHLNRVFRSSQPTNEMMVYDFLYRHLRSAKAKNCINEKQ